MALGAAECGGSPGGHPSEIDYITPMARRRRWATIELAACGCGNSVTAFRCHRRNQMGFHLLGRLAQLSHLIRR
jgi:hypothetical protein